MTQFEYADFLQNDKMKKILMLCHKNENVNVWL